VGFFLAYLAARLKLGAAFSEADDLAQNLSATRAMIGSLPAARVGPTMLGLTQNATPADRDAALQLSRQVQELEKQTPGSAFGPEDYRRVAQELVRAKSYEKALDFLNDGEAQHPRDPSLPLYVGAIYGMYLNDNASADDNYFKALSIDSQYAPAHYNLACSSARKFKLDGNRDFLKKAHMYLEDAFRLDPGLPERSKTDPVWDGVRDEPELQDILPQISK
jgi:tetratricopeptide (TPR) repeat protein